MTIYRVGEVDFDPDASEIRAQGQVKHLQPQVSNVLTCLLRHQGEVVPKDLLVEEAWEGRRTSDESVTRCISLLRAQLADRDQPRLIETIPKKGYRFNGSVQEMPELAEEAREACNESHGPAAVFADRPRTAVNLVMTGVLLLLLFGLLVTANFLPFG